MPTSLRISLLITPLGGDAGQGEGGKKPVEGGKPAEGKPEVPAEGAKPPEWGGQRRRSLHNLQSRAYLLVWWV